ncbi:ribose-phosphate diphosphokinase [Candidatus Daviesbacteria bacterium]|nr:ribose-phosphate diphosphokinase [Candidatus Daviesbacteria bacterium]
MTSSNALDNFVILTGTSNPSLAEDIGKILKRQVYKPVTKFADGESRVQIPINIRRGSVVIIQSTCPPDVDGSIIELLLMIDAAKRASADEIIVMIPYFGYSRQDRKDKSRVPISASMIARIIEFAGAAKISTVDIHSDPQQGFIKSPWDNLYGSYSLVPIIEELNIKNLVIASPDKGGVPMASAYAKRLNAQGLAIVFKERDVNTQDQSETLEMIGQVNGKTVLMVDDMISTAGTICNAAKLIKERGAEKIIVAATHGLFSNKALENIENSPIEKVYITDTITQPKQILDHSKIEVVTVAPMLAEAIRRIETGESISETLILPSNY